MGSNMYLYEKARESHDQDLLREMAESRLLEMSRSAEGVSPRRKAQSFRAPL